MLLELSREMPPAALLAALNGLQQAAVQHLDGMVEVGDLLVSDHHSYSVSALSLMYRQMDLLLSCKS
jgi:hypothetical protein